MEETIRKEMPFLKWLTKFTERCDVIQLSIKQKLEIREEDWEIVRLLHRNHFLGNLPIYETILINRDEDSQSVTQTDLFSADQSVTATVETIGTEIENILSETIKEKKDGKEVLDK